MTQRMTTLWGPGSDITKQIHFFFVASRLLGKVLWTLNNKVFLIKSSSSWSQSGSQKPLKKLSFIFIFFPDIKGYVKLVHVVQESFGQLTFRLLIRFYSFYQA